MNREILIKFKLNRIDKKFIELEIRNGFEKDPESIELEFIHYILFMVIEIILLCNAIILQKISSKCLTTLHWRMLTAWA